MARFAEDESRSQDLIDQAVLRAHVVPAGERGRRGDLTSECDEVDAPTRAREPLLARAVRAVQAGRDELRGLVHEPGDDDILEGVWLGLVARVLEAAECPQVKGEAHQVPEGQAVELGSHGDGDRAQPHAADVGRGLDGQPMSRLDDRQAALAGQLSRCLLRQSLVAKEDLPALAAGLRRPRLPFTQANVEACRTRVTRIRIDEQRAGARRARRSSHV